MKKAGIMKLEESHSNTYTKATKQCCRKTKTQQQKVECEPDASGGVGVLVSHPHTAQLLLFAAVEAIVRNVLGFRKRTMGVYSHTYIHMLDNKNCKNKCAATTPGNYLPSH